MQGRSFKMQQERHPRNPSFSSVLLDAMYRSTDDVDGSLYICRKMTTSTTTTATNIMHERTNNSECNTKQTPRLFKWATHEKKAAEKVALRRKASELGVLEAVGGYRLSSKSVTRANSSTTSSSSESSGFSSSESDSVLALNEQKKAAKKKQHDQKDRPPPVVIPPKNHHYTAAPDFFPGRKIEESQKIQGIRASKLYKDVKKAKQPISPGSRIASFLNSIFATAKKAKLSSTTRTTALHPPSKPPSLSTDTLNRPATRASSTASTTTTPSSRSCLSKTPSTRGEGVRRSVRFYPTSVIVGEDSQPCSHKCLDVPDEEELSRLPASSAADLFPWALISERVRARDLIAHYQMKSSSAASFLVDLSQRTKLEEESEDDESDDDAASYSSSDLFELENLTELPVYETTSLETNHAIAKGLIL